MSATEIAVLQKKHGFSAAYASVLRAQNGFRIGTLADAKERDRFLSESPATSSTLDFAQLFTVAELPNAQHRVRAVGTWFFPIGKGYGGDQYAEVLHGTHRGSIVHLNKDIILGTSSFDQIAEAYDGFEDFDIDFNALSVDEQADFLVETEELDLVARLAASIDEFLALCVHCDTERFIGRSVAAPQGVTKKKAAPATAASLAKAAPARAKGKKAVPGKRKTAPKAGPAPKNKAAAKVAKKKSSVPPKKNRPTRRATRT